MAFDAEIRFGLDRSIRRMDADGRMHVELTPISKATVNPYYGREIPGGDALGLTPDRIYNLLRDPDELSQGAASSNNMQLLEIHDPVSAEDPKREIVVGSTGTDGVFVSPYLMNSLVIWDAEAIAAINSNKKKQLSCGYRYVADMTPGTYKGLRYDGVMRNIVFNHVALVKEGRAGPDVVVGDSQLETRTMKPSLKSILVRGALASAIKPLLAQDSKIDYAALAAGVTAANFKDMKPAILGRVAVATKGKLAADATLDSVTLALDAAEEEEAEDEEETESEEERLEREASDRKKAKDKKAKDAKAAKDAEGESEEDKEAKDAKRAKDEEEAEAAAEANAAKDKKAMDAAINTGVEAGVKAALAVRDAIDTAKREVRPFVGELTSAFDSADQVYRLALDAAAVDLKDVPPAAFGALVRMLDKPSDPSRDTRRIALDSAMSADVNNMFPDLARINHA